MLDVRALLGERLECLCVIANLVVAHRENSEAEQMGHAVKVLELVVVQDQLLQVDEGRQR